MKYKTVGELYKAIGRALPEGVRPEEPVCFTTHYGIIYSLFCHRPRRLWDKPVDLCAEIATSFSVNFTKEEWGKIGIKLDKLAECAIETPEKLREEELTYSRRED